MLANVFKQINYVISSLITREILIKAFLKTDFNHPKMLREVQKQKEKIFFMLIITKIIYTKPLLLHI